MPTEQLAELARGLRGDGHAVVAVAKQVVVGGDATDGSRDDTLSHTFEVAQAELLGVVSDSLSRFMGQLKATTRSNDVTIMVYSEFGRRVAGNGSQGTDHGTSGPMFVVGNSVKGGFYGDQPSLKNLVKGDLAVTTDFRDVYATMIEKVLKSPVDPTLGKWAGRVDCLN